MRFSATPENAGNLPVKKKAAHINPEAPGAPEVTKLERGDNFVQRSLIYASIWSKLFFCGSKLDSFDFFRPGSAEIAGNVPVKRKAAHINPEAPGAPEVTKLERGGHFVQHNLIYASIWSKLFCSG